MGFEIQVDRDGSVLISLGCAVDSLRDLAKSLVRAQKHGGRIYIDAEFLGRNEAEFLRVCSLIHQLYPDIQHVSLCPPPFDSILAKALAKGYFFPTLAELSLEDMPYDLPLSSKGLSRLPTKTHNNLIIPASDSLEVVARLGGKLESNEAAPTISRGNATVSNGENKKVTRKKFLRSFRIALYSRRILPAAEAGSREWTLFV